MKGLIAYSNERDKWELWALHGKYNDLVPPPAHYNLTQEGRYLFPKIIEAEVLWVEEEETVAEGTWFTWATKHPLPEMPTLHERIKANIEVLKNWSI